MSNDTKECPYCAETIKAKAIVCRYCGRDLPAIVPIQEQIEVPEEIKKIEEPNTLEQNVKTDDSEKPETPIQPSIKTNKRLARLKLTKKPILPGINNDTKLVIGLLIACGIVLVILYNMVAPPHANQSVYLTPTNKDTSSQEQLNILATALTGMEADSTANPDGHLHDVMKKEGVTLTAKEVQYDMANKVGQKFGLSGKAEICDYYNWGYDESIKDRYFCVSVTPLNATYAESWYIYFNRQSAAELYQDLLSGKNVMVFLIAKIDSSLYDKNQGNMATGLYTEWNSW